MEDEQKIVFAGESNQEPGVTPGDIVVVLEEKEHPVFKRRGMDLIMEMVRQVAMCADTIQSSALGGCPRL
jgi:DnaJ homolog subfamily A member 1